MREDEDTKKFAPAGKGAPIDFKCHHCYRQFIAKPLLDEHEQKAHGVVKNSLAPQLETRTAASTNDLTAPQRKQQQSRTEAAEYITQVMDSTIAKDPSGAPLNPDQAQKVRALAQGYIHRLDDHFITSLEDLRIFTEEELATKLGIDKPIFAKKIFLGLRPDAHTMNRSATEAQGISNFVSSVKEQQSRVIVGQIPDQDEAAALASLQSLAENFQPGPLAQFVKTGTNAFFQRHGGFNPEAIRGFDSLDLASLRLDPGKTFSQTWMIGVRDLLTFLNRRLEYMSDRVEVVKGSDTVEHWPEEIIYAALEEVTPDHRSFSDLASSSRQFTAAVLKLCFQQSDKGDSYKIRFDALQTQVEDDLLDKYEEMWAQEDYEITDADPAAELDLLLTGSPPPHCRPGQDGHTKDPRAALRQRRPHHPLSQSEVPRPRCCR